MRIKITSPTGTLCVGQIYDAAVSPNRQMAFLYDESNIAWSMSPHQFEIIEEKSTEPIEHIWSLRDLLGQDVKTIEFK